MNRLTAALTAALLFALALPSHADDDGDNGYKLPAEPARVITLDFTGGGAARPADSGPYLTIEAGEKTDQAKVIGGRTMPNLKAVEHSMPIAELQALLEFVIKQQDLLQIDAGKIQRQLKQQQAQAGGLRRAGSFIADAATTKVQLDLPDHQHEVSYYALSTHARKHEDVEMLQKLETIVERLRRVHARATVGERMDSVLDAATQALEGEQPDAEPLTADDLFRARLRQDDSLFVIFRRTGETAGGERLMVVRGEIPAAGEPALNVRVRPVDRD